MAAANGFFFGGEGGGGEQSNFVEFCIVTKRRGERRFVYAIKARLKEALFRVITGETGSS